MFKLLAPVQWEEAASQGRAKKGSAAVPFLSAATETQLLIYEVSMSWVGHVLPERPATGGREGVESEK